MRATNVHSAVATEIGRTLRKRVAPAPAAQVHGGCISESYRWTSDGGPLFVKVAPADRLPIFEAEVAGLETLKDAHAVRVPDVLAVGCADDRAFLALEWIELGAENSGADARLGEQLAMQHRVTAERFGWHRDNAIGSTAQLNAESTDWLEFFRERRLRYQLDLAKANGYGGALHKHGPILLERMEGFFTNYHPQPSLLHGDLWGGNWGVDSDGAPLVFDPAVYFGDREADIAMTRLFGGFGASFYRAYESSWPLDAGAATRTELYNLYHVLNHLNIFGSGYLAQAESMLSRLLSPTR